MVNNVMNHVWLMGQLRVVEEGLRFPQSAINGILLSNTSREKVIVNAFEDKVLEFIQQKDGRIYLSEICEKFKLSSIHVNFILNKLEKSGKINVNW